MRRKMKIVEFWFTPLTPIQCNTYLGWAPWLSYMWPSHPDKEMDKGNQKVFRCQLLCEQESEERDELQNPTNSHQLAQEEVYWKSRGQ